MADVAADVLPAGPLLVHVDFDVVDPGDLPGLLFPAPGRAVAGVRDRRTRPGAAAHLADAPPSG